MIDVAESLGVSRATVSLAMRRSPLLTAATRDQVLAEADRLGYVYNQTAASLRTQRTNMVALVMPDVVNPFVAELSLGAQEALAELGYFVMITNTNDDLATQRSVLKSLAEQRVAGVIIIPALHSDGSDLHPAGDRLPTLVLYRSLRDSTLPSVGTADDTIGSIGAGHLIGDHQCRRVGYFGGELAATPRVERERSFRAAATGAGVEIDESWTAPLPADMRSAHRVARQLLAAGPPPDGILCHSDQVAYGLLKAMAEHGLDSTHCAVVGIDDLQASSMWTPSVSSVAVHPVDLGRVSGRILLDLLGESVSGDRTVPRPVLHRRSSCGCRAD
ncbi:LacI family transcriptional regulator [Microlunatus soli]|uniref:LacI family transcriptional regulator n=2 Tax=Microlunatus soli TaxID=630515 RepID=A0A1H1TD51_9ACTN|nr:LacI family transcriptional regulator [Microlunatus soli]